MDTHLITYILCSFITGLNLFTSLKSSHNKTSIAIHGVCFGFCFCLLFEHTLQQLI